MWAEVLVDIQVCAPFHLILLVLQTLVVTTLWLCAWYVVAVWQVVCTFLLYLYMAVFWDARPQIVFAQD